jgi:hypothetical protein
MNFKTYLQESKNNYSSFFKTKHTEIDSLKSELDSKASEVWGKFIREIEKKYYIASTDYSPTEIEEKNGKYSIIVTGPIMIAEDDAQAEALKGMLNTSTDFLTDDIESKVISNAVKRAGGKSYKIGDASGASRSIDIKITIG